jgi:hypothetical protein
VSLHATIVTTLARSAVTFFSVTNVLTFMEIYGWLHPVVWTATIIAFVAVEGIFYYIRKARSAADVEVAVAMWISVGAWVSVENFIVLVSSIVVLRAMPEGWPLRVAAFVVAAGIGALTTLADINPWSSDPGELWLRRLFIANCFVNILLVLARASLPREEQ